MKIVISGFYGAKNTGDEAILSSIIFSINKKYPISKYTIFSLDKTHTMQIHKNEAAKIETVFRPCFDRKFLKSEFLKMYLSIKESNLVIIGGGGILQDVHNYLTIPCFLHTVILAKLMNKPVMFYSIGVGPFKNKVSKFLVKYICNISDLITVRDEESKECLTSIGVDKTSIIVTVDPVFALTPISSDKARKILINENVPLKKPMIGISVRWVKWFKLNEQIFANLFDYLVDKYNATIVFIPFGYDGIPSDLEISEKLIKKARSKMYLIKGKYTPSEILGIVGQCDFLIGMRFHSIIMSLIMKVPFLGISYLPKVRSLLKQLNYDSSCYIDNLENISLNSLKQKFENNYSKRSLTQKEIEKSANIFINKAIYPSSLIDNIDSKKISSLYLIFIIFLYFLGFSVLLIYELSDILSKNIRKWQLH
jgi:polysaccharide pyruvyl transferase CsaB